MSPQFKQQCCSFVGQVQQPATEKGADCWKGTCDKCRGTLDYRNQPRRWTVIVKLLFVGNWPVFGGMHFTLGRVLSCWLEVSSWCALFWEVWNCCESKTSKDAVTDAQPVPQSCRIVQTNCCDFLGTREQSCLQPENHYFKVMDPLQVSIYCSVCPKPRMLPEQSCRYLGGIPSQRTTSWYPLQWLDSMTELIKPCQLETFAIAALQKITDTMLLC